MEIDQVGVLEILENANFAYDAFEGLFVLPHVFYFLYSDLSVTSEVKGSGD